MMEIECVHGLKSGNARENHEIVYIAGTEDGGVMVFVLNINGGWDMDIITMYIV